MGDVELVELIKELLDEGGKVPIEFAMSIVVKTADGGINEVVGDGLSEMADKIDGIDGMQVIGLRPDFERMVRYINGLADCVLQNIPNDPV